MCEKQQRVPRSLDVVSNSDEADGTSKFRYDRLGGNGTRRLQRLRFLVRANEKTYGVFQ